MTGNSFPSEGIEKRRRRRTEDKKGVRNEGKVRREDRGGRKYKRKVAKQKDAENERNKGREVSRQESSDYLWKVNVSSLHLSFRLSLPISYRALRSAQWMGNNLIKAGEKIDNDRLDGEKSEQCIVTCCSSHSFTLVELNFQLFSSVHIWDGFNWDQTQCGGLKGKEKLESNWKKRNRVTAGLRKLDSRSMMRGYSLTMQIGTRRRKLKRRHDRAECKTENSESSGSDWREWSGLMPHMSRAECLTLRETFLRIIHLVRFIQFIYLRIIHLSDLELFISPMKGNKTG